MCTAISHFDKNHYFGRNLDLDYSYQESITICPRNYPFKFKYVDKIFSNHYAMIGMAYVQDDYPLYYEASNESGLSVAGLNFPHSAQYQEYKEDKTNICPYELIPYLLSQFSTVDQVCEELKKMNIVNSSFSPDLPLAPLHWLISDKKRSITVESNDNQLNIYDNPVAVLTNEPKFDYHLFNLNNYLSLGNATPKNTFSEKIDLKSYCLGMGGLGLPGDLSSMSRFVRVAFTKLNSVSETSRAGETATSEEERVGQFFHILDSVAQTKGASLASDSSYEFTIYSSCCNTDKGIYYYTTYENRQISSVSMHKENLETDVLISYPMIKEEHIYQQN